MDLVKQEKLGGQNFKISLSKNPIDPVYLVKKLNVSLVLRAAGGLPCRFAQFLKSNLLKTPIENVYYTVQCRSSANEPE